MLERQVFSIAVDRTAPVERSALATHIPIIISSDRVVDMGAFLERLDHSSNAIDFSRAADGLPFLHSHDTGKLPLGRVEQVTTDGHKLRGKLKMGTGPDARQVAADIENGTLTHVSVGYKVHAREKRGNVIHVTRWSPHEVSAVAVPADPEARIGGRSVSPIFETRNFHMNIENKRSLDLSPADKRRYSLSKALLSMSHPGQFNADFERECSDELAKRFQSPPRGIYLPEDVFSLETREIDTTGTASNLVATKLLAGSFIDLLRNETAVIKLGATLLPDQVGNVAIPQQTGAATVAWISEGAAAVESDQTFSQVTASPHTLSAWTQYSRKTLLQATPAIEKLIRDDLVRVAAIEIDRVAVNGSGASNQPTGILNVAGIGSVAMGTNGGAPTWAGVLGLIEQLANANALRGSLGFLSNSKVANTLMQTAKIGSTYPLFILDEPYTSLVGHPFAVSNNIPSNLTKGTGTNLSAMLFANWADLLILQWGPPLDVLVDPYSSSTTGSVKVIEFSSLDVQVRHPVSFAADVDLIAA